ncbi:hypothetical protein GJ496_003775 [Pomphorhynchus laevis]|nr:hypothetical protein GJ496_003775 [Pomphorhynchus laevis]
MCTSNSFLCDSELQSSNKNTAEFNVLEQIHKKKVQSFLDAGAKLYEHSYTRSSVESADFVRAYIDGDLTIALLGYPEQTAAHIIAGRDAIDAAHDSPMTIISDRLKKWMHRICAIT